MEGVFARKSGCLRGHRFRGLVRPQASLPSSAGRWRWELLAAVVVLVFALAPAVRAAGFDMWEYGFEDEDEFWSCWTVQIDPDLVEFSTSNPHGGSKCICISGNAQQGSGVKVVSPYIRADFDDDYTVSFAFRYSDFHWDRFIIFGHIRLLLDYPWLPIKYDPVGDNSFVGNNLSDRAFNSFLPANKWGKIVIHCRPSERKYWVFIEGEYVGEVQYQASVTPSHNWWFEDNASPTNFLTACFDDFKVHAMQEPPDFIVPGIGIAGTVCSTWVNPPVVPYHSQYLDPCSPPYPNGRCMPACLEMVFDRFGDNLPVNIPPTAQEWIAAAANTNDRVNCPNGNWSGTYRDDLRRAAHFSSAMKALTNTRGGCPPSGCPSGNPPAGYGWRTRGYAAFDGVWTQFAPDDTVDVYHRLFPTDLARFLASGYPIIALIDPDAYDCDSLYADTSPEAPGEKDCLAPIEHTIVGHACLLIGYDKLGAWSGNATHRPAFLLHDPALGRNLWIGAQYFWDSVWVGKEFVFAAPWEIHVAAPDNVSGFSSFTVSAIVSYTGPKPLDALFPVTGANVKLTASGAGFQGGESATHQLTGIGDSGDAAWTHWNLFAGAGFSGITLSLDAFATLSPASSSHSYQSYADNIGYTASGLTLATSPVYFPAPDPGHAGWPYGGGWWRPGFGGGSLRLVTTGSGGLLYVGLLNMGDEPIHPCTLSLYAHDPAVTECKVLQEALEPMPFAEIDVPTLAPGDSVTLGPIEWNYPGPNSFGEPYYAFWSEIDCPEDPPESIWPEDENNYGVHAYYEFIGALGEPVSMQFFMANPDSDPREMLLVAEVSGEAEQWEVILDPPEPVLVPGEQMWPCSATIVPQGDLREGAVVDVECLMSYPGGEFIRKTGGLGIRIDPDVSGSGEPAEWVPTTVLLWPPAPNPSTGWTLIRYALPRETDVRLRVFDLSGRLISDLSPGLTGPGMHTLRWDGRDQHGLRVPAGVYFCRLEPKGLSSKEGRLVIVR